MIDMEKYDGSKYTARYSTFKVGSKEKGYVLNIGGFSSNPVFDDDLSAQNGMKFSTSDIDRDLRSTVNVAQQQSGGWWYGSHWTPPVKLTGKHSDSIGIHWKSVSFALKKVSMKVRRC